MEASCVGAHGVGNSTVDSDLNNMNNVVAGGGAAFGELTNHRVRRHVGLAA
jgi:hypothetical protein